MSTGRFCCPKCGFERLCKVYDVIVKCPKCDYERENIGIIYNFCEHTLPIYLDNFDDTIEKFIKEIIERANRLKDGKSQRMVSKSHYYIIQIFDNKKLEYIKQKIIGYENEIHLKDKHYDSSDFINEKWNM